MNEEKREEAIKQISKYLFIFLKSLRKLDFFYPKGKYMYRCINKKVNLNKDNSNNYMISYLKGNIKVFWGFTSITSNVNMNYKYKGKVKEIEKGTIFDLYGNIWGYDISLFNSLVEEHKILEPEWESLVMNSISSCNSNKDLIHIRCKLEKCPSILDGLINRYDFRIVYTNYDYKKYIRYIRIFGKEFVNNNKNVFKYIFEGKEYDLEENFEIKNNNEKIELYLIKFDHYLNFNKMFYNCPSLTSFECISNYYDFSITDMGSMFYGCSSLSSLPDISKWNTSKVRDISFMFYECTNINDKINISKMDTSNVENMNSVFFGCKNLNKLPDISKWNTSNVENITSLFYGCMNIIYLPDISKWNTSNVKYMSSLFCGCKKLINLPDISKWNTSQVIYMDHLFYGCSNLLELPDISKWNT